MPAKRTPSKSDKTVKAVIVEPVAIASHSQQRQTVSNHDQISSGSTLNNFPEDEGADLSSMDNKGLVVFSLRQILTDAGASAAAKASAARTLAEIEGVLGRHAAPPKDASKPLASMTREELEAELAKESAGNA